MIVAGLQFVDEEKDPVQDYIRLLSHQLKSPINAIETLLNTILEGYAGDLDEKTKYILQKAVGRSFEAREIITDLMDYELYSESGIGAQEDVDLCELCSSLADRYMVTASDRNIAFHVSMPSESTVFVRGAARGLEHVLRNLIENAFKYTPESGSVSLQLSAEEDSKTCRIDVVDSGSGIPEDELESIFLPFYRSVTHRSGVPGTGLGLPIVKRIVDGHKGKIHVGSQLGKGSTFTVTLELLRLESRLGERAPKRKVVIIGGVTAGPKAAARLRRLDENLDITIVEKGGFLSYSGCGLPGYISGKISSPRALMVTGDSTARDIDFFEAIDNVRILNNTLATDLDRKNRHIEIEDLRSGRRSLLPYDTLVLATGAMPSIPPIPGINQDRIHTLRSLEDAEAIRSELSTGEARDVYFIGGGLIGISAAEELQDAGARITILEKKEYVLQKMLDRDIAIHIQAELNRKGIKILTDCEVQKIESVGHTLRIRTSRGSHDADIIIVSAGVSPNVELARDAGLDIGESGGIKISKYLRTSDESIFAVGDCAESNHIITGKHEYWPLGSVSTKMGRIAADNICGRNVEFSGSVGTTLFRMRDLNIARTGLTSRSAWKAGFDVVSTVVTGSDHATMNENDNESMVLKLLADRDTQVVLGAQGFGSGNVAGKIEIIAGVITSGFTLTDVFCMDLGYSPSHNNPIDLTQTSCLMLQNKIEGLVSLISPEDLNRSKAHIISVCPQGTYSKYEIPGSINIPLERIRTERIPYEKDSEIVLYSKTSSGAYKAYRYLSLQGFRDLKVLEGGFLFWRR